MGFVRDILVRLGARLSPKFPTIDETTWEVVELPLPADAKKPYLDVIRGTPDGDVWILGTVYASATGEMRFACRERDGRLDRIVEMPRGMLSVAPLSQTSVWFAGRGGALAHFDGTAWTRHAFEGFYYDFLDVFARDGSDVWLAATGARVVHFDRTSFQVDTPTVLAGSSTHELWGTATDLLVPVNAARQPTSVARRTAAGWTREELGYGGATLIHGSAPDDIWVLSRTAGGWHWDGTEWRRHPIGPGRFWALHVAAPDRAYAVGDAGALATWDGARWTMVSIGSDRLVSVYRRRDGRLLVGGSRLYRSRVTR